MLIDKSIKHSSREILAVFLLDAVVHLHCYCSQILKAVRADQASTTYENSCEAEKQQIAHLGDTDKQDSFSSIWLVRYIIQSNTLIYANQRGLDNFPCRSLSFQFCPSRLSRLRVFDSGLVGVGFKFPSDHSNMWTHLPFIKLVLSIQVIFGS